MIIVDVKNINGILLVVKVRIVFEDFICIDSKFIDILSIVKR